MKGVIFLFLSVTCAREDCAIVRLGWDVTAWMGTYDDKQGTGESGSEGFRHCASNDKLFRQHKTISP